MWLILLAATVRMCFAASNWCNQEACNVTADCDIAFGAQVCCGGVCTKTSSLPMARLGMPCNVSGMETEICAGTAQCGEGTCQSGVCSRLLDDSCACSMASQCQAATCAVSQCGGDLNPDLNPDGSACNENGDCMSGDCFNVDERWDGVSGGRERCGTVLARYAECDEGLRDEQYCPLGHVCYIESNDGTPVGGGMIGNCTDAYMSALGAWCFFDLECPEGTWCDDGGSNQCEAGRAEGEPCGNSMECNTTLICGRDNQCHLPEYLTTYDRCDFDAECNRTMTCTGGRCMFASTVAEGETCQYNDECIGSDDIVRVRCTDIDSAGAVACVRDHSVVLGGFCTRDRYCALGLRCNGLDQCDDAIGSLCSDDGDCGGVGVGCVCAGGVTTCQAVDIVIPDDDLYCLPERDAERAEGTVTARVRWECCHGCAGRSQFSPTGRKYDCTAFTQEKVAQCSVTAIIPTVFTKCPPGSRGEERDPVADPNSGAAVTGSCGVLLLSSLLVLVL